VSSCAQCKIRNLFSTGEKRTILLMPRTEKSRNNHARDNAKMKADFPELLSPEAARAELLTLLRLLVREPPRDHEFKTCAICKRYRITGI
jgi:hypothetical protein